MINAAGTSTGSTSITATASKTKSATKKRVSKVVGNSLVWYYVNEPLTSTGTTTVVKAKFTISNLLRLSSVKRQPFLLPVVDSVDDENVDTLFKIMRLYQSLDTADTILESVRRQSQEELDAYLQSADLDITWSQDIGIPKPLPDTMYDSNTKFGGWLNEDGTVTAIIGQKGFIGMNADGIFRGKDGWLGVFLGTNRG